jgi:hypothetical protein
MQNIKEYTKYSTINYAVNQVIKESRGLIIDCTITVQNASSRKLRISFTVVVLGLKGKSHQDNRGREAATNEL